MDLQERLTTGSAFQSIIFDSSSYYLPFVFSICDDGLVFKIDQ